MRIQQIIALFTLLAMFWANPAMAQTTENPDYLQLSGPRLGFAIFTGNISQRIQDPTSTGGLNAKPIMSQIGYQFEKAYISNEKFQALFEFYPNITGLDQGKFLPSFSILHGLRLNQTGWEFIAGPIIYLTKRTEGFFDLGNNNKWTRIDGWKIDNPTAAEPENVIKMLDTRAVLA